MRDPGHAPIQAGPQRRWIRTVRAYLHEPAVLTIIAVAFFISAAGQRFGRPRPRSWSLSRGPGLIDSDLIDAARMAEVLGQAVEEAGGARLDRSGRRRTILRVTKALSWARRSVPAASFDDHGGWAGSISASAAMCTISRAPMAQRGIHAARGGEP
jgi:hypothetical protein